VVRNSRPARAGTSRGNSVLGNAIAEPFPREKPVLATINGKVEIICEYCGQPFYDWPASAKRRHCCSRSCSRKARASKPKLRLCRLCGAEFTIRGRQTARYCSDECRKSARKKAARRRRVHVTVVCRHCQKPFEITPSEAKVRKFCSLKCAATHNCGSEASSQQYDSSFNELVRRLIRERDGYTCAICGTPDSNVVHHIDYDKSNTSGDNLITLCRSCHSKTGLDRQFWRQTLIDLLKARYSLTYLSVSLDRRGNYCADRPQYTALPLYVVPDRQPVREPDRPFGGYR
jgi:hypothetical protein